LEIKNQKTEDIQGQRQGNDNKFSCILEKEVTSADKRIAFSQFRPEAERATINSVDPV